METHNTVPSDIPVDPVSENDDEASPIAEIDDEEEDDNDKKNNGDKETRQPLKSS